jgi:hypothetical protein
VKGGRMEDAWEKRERSLVSKEGAGGFTRSQCARIASLLWSRSAQA